MLKLTVEITGKTEGDIELALQETLRKVEGGYKSGFDRNDSGRYSFEIEGEEEPVEEE